MIILLLKLQNGGTLYLGSRDKEVIMSILIGSIVILVSLLVVPIVVLGVVISIFDGVTKSE